MGSFFGHALPGTFFVMAGIWWCIQTYRRYYQSMTRQGRPFASSVTFPVTLCSRRVDIEAIFVIVSCGLGMLVELIIAPIFHHTPLGMNNLQHGTMYFFFLQTGVLSLLGKRLKLMPSVDEVLYISLALAFVAEAALFKFHLFGRSGIDVLIHTLLLYVLYASAACTLLEMRYRRSVLLPLCRSFFTIVQGTWFWQAGFFLYNPLSGNAWSGPYDMHGHSVSEQHLSAADEKAMHETMLFMVCTFAWHMAAIFILIITIGSLIGCGYKCQTGSDQMSLLPSKDPATNGYSMLDERELEEEEDDGA